MQRSRVFGRVPFTGANLDALPMSQLPPVPDGDPAATPLALPFPGTRFKENRTDEVGHPADCGNPANTDITYAVFRLPFVSVRSVFFYRFPNTPFGFRQFVTPGRESVKAILGVRA